MARIPPNFLSLRARRTHYGHWTPSVRRQQSERFTIDRLNDVEVSVVAGEQRISDSCAAKTASDAVRNAHREVAVPSNHVVCAPDLSGRRGCEVPGAPCKLRLDPRTVSGTTNGTTSVREGLTRSCGI